MDANGKPTKVDAAPAVSTNPATGVYLTSENVEGTAVWSTRGRWCTLTGNSGGHVVTIAILDHPKNPNYPTYWHARGYGLFAANPLGQHIFDPKAPELGFRLDQGQSATFHYRVLLIDGKSSPSEMNAEADRFAAEYTSSEMPVEASPTRPSDYFSNWPEGISHQEVGKRVAEHFVTSPHQYTATIHYSEAATWC
jgi:hypothetical protein